MGTIGFLRNRARVIRKTCYFILFISVAIYIIVPLCFFSSHHLQKHFVFVNDIPIPKSIEFDHPEIEGVMGGINRYIKTDGVRLGVWQILPISLISDMPPLLSSMRNLWFLKQLSDGKPVFIYCHGNHPSRATYHRILLYDVLQGQDYHVITFDYRGYADSENISPSEDGVVADTMNMYHWVKNHTDAPVFIYAHSLGTGISTKAVAKLCQRNMCPQALFLQSPFTSIADMLRTSIAVAPYRILPWFDSMFIKPLREDGTIFDSKENILSVKCPVMILHAEDDYVVPFILGKELYESAQKSRNKSYGQLKFVPFADELDYGHNFIYRSPRLPSLINDFMKDALQFNSNDI